MLNSISQQSDIDQIYLNGKDLIEPKYEFVIEKREDAGIKYFHDSKAIIECSNTMHDVYFMGILMITTQQEREKLSLFLMT